MPHSYQMISSKADLCQNFHIWLCGLSRTAHILIKVLRISWKISILNRAKKCYLSKAMLNHRKAVLYKRNCFVHIFNIKLFLLWRLAVHNSLQFLNITWYDVIKIIHNYDVNGNSQAPSHLLPVTKTVHSKPQKSIQEAQKNRFSVVSCISWCS